MWDAKRLYWSKLIFFAKDLDFWCKFGAVAYNQAQHLPINPDKTERFKWLILL
jgi:hypothetical protein